MIRRRSFLGAAIAASSFPALSLGQTAQKESTAMKFRMSFNGETMTATLLDNSSARELATILPLDLTIGDYSTNEKIAYLPSKLKEVVDEPFGDERPGDVAYYAPWGNLVFFHDAYRYSKGLIRLGRFDDGFEPLLVRGDFPLRIERV
jgi:hypothetical protein